MADAKHFIGLMQYELNLSFSNKRIEGTGGVRLRLMLEPRSSVGWWSTFFMASRGQEEPFSRLALAV